MPVEITLTPAYGWSNCYRITNGDVELILTSDVGPRILRYAFPGAKNLFVEFPQQLGRSGEPHWVPRGGHRIWFAPEDRVRTYAADNNPVVIHIDGSAITAIQPVEPESGLEKQITIRLAPSGSHVEVIHSLKNCLAEPQRIAPWALTMAAPGGIGITGFPPRGTHPEILAPTNPLTMWAFTNLGDPRWHFTRKYLFLRQDPSNSVPQKIGLFNPDTWGAYFLHNTLFLKRYTADPTRTYPDFGASYETFTNADVLELETLGPLETVAPGATIKHTERWSLHANISFADWTDEELDGILLPLLS